MSKLFTEISEKDSVGFHFPTYPHMDLSKNAALRAAIKNGYLTADLIHCNRKIRTFETFCSPRRSHRRNGQWRRPGSNRQPPACKAGALPIELRPRDLFVARISSLVSRRQTPLARYEPRTPSHESNGPGKSRTSDLTLIRGAL